MTAVTDIDRENQKTYGRIAPDFALRNAETPPNLATLADRLARHVGPHGLVADIGGGHGRDTAYLEWAGVQVITLDLSLHMLRQAQQIRRGTLAQSNMKSVCLKDHCCDGIWCCAALPHLPKAQAPVALGEFRRIIRDGGLLVLSLQQGSGEGWLWSERDRVTRYFSRYAASEIRARLGMGGFSVISSVTTPGLSAPWLALVCRP